MARFCGSCRRVTDGSQIPLQGKLKPKLMQSKRLVLAIAKPTTSKRLHPTPRSSKQCAKRPRVFAHAVCYRPKYAILWRHAA